MWLYWGNGFGVSWVRETSYGRGLLSRGRVLSGVHGVRVENLVGVVVVG